jgi:hypothetical protein
MAQTKRKRQTKHRGNAAGIIEARGRTGRAPSADEKSGKGGAKVPRQDRPPEWRSAFTRAMIATVALLFIGVLLLPSSKKGLLLVYFPVILAIYTVVGYQTDKFLYQRRQRRKAAGKVAS